MQTLTSSYSMGRNLDAKAVSESFKEWFMGRRRQRQRQAEPWSEEALVEEIFRILSAHEEEREFSVNLSRLGFRVTESLVLRVLSCAHPTTTTPQSNKADTENDVIYSCVKFFDWAGRQPEFVHTRSTYHAIFKILATAKQMTVLLDYLEHFRLYGAQNFYSTVVMGYAIAGKPHFALQLLGRMRYQGLDLDLFSYHVLLHSLLQHGSFHAVNDLHRQIQSRDLVNHFTHFLMVKSLCLQRLTDQAESYLRRTLPSSTDAREFKRCHGGALSFLIDTLCQEGKLNKAGELVREFSWLGPVPMWDVYGTWLKCLVRAGKIDAASDFLKAKKSLEGYVPEVFRYNFLLTRLLKEDRLQDALDLLIDMKESGITPDRLTMNSALCFFCKAGMVSVAFDLYSSISDLGFSPNTMAFNYLINSLCGHGSCEEAFSVLRNSASQGCFPGKETFFLLADALCRESKFDLMMELLAIARELDFTPRVSTYNRIISALCMNNRVEDAYVLHGELNSLNKTASSSTYTSLITAFNKANRPDIAGRLLVEMQDKGHVHSDKLFSGVVSGLCKMENTESQFLKLLEMQLSLRENSCDVYNSFIHGAGHAGKPDLARQVYEMMQQNVVKPNSLSKVRMLKSYLKAGRIADALNFFYALRKTERPHRKLYNIMIKGLCRLNRTDLALEFFWERLTHGRNPSIESFELLIRLLCLEKRYDLAVNIVREFHNCVYGNRPITSFIGNTLLLHALKSGELYEAWARWKVEQNELSSHLSDISNLIGVFSGRIRLSQQVDDLEEAIKQCFPPDIFTYNVLLRRLCMSEIDLACEFFDVVCQKGYKPNQWTYDILIRGLLKHERRSEAMKLVKEMVRNGFETTLLLG
ncbi:hypothetical protein Tsubulata_017392 [Turnera subulata]|uniref:Pentacotripeptide-repeat region of PRORP domain-containing protein n=1 Tax=Turnera subulata TaxID=218843 RepID=A0A9Q0FYQ0_9ROSI|nr:hypothetical protein Tsubulata_017392 [Turnera subulata]